MNDEKARDPKFVQITTSVHGGEILLYALEAGDGGASMTRLASG
jgi:hypothetical protein